MKLQDGIDFTTLNWVKQELDETLKQARGVQDAVIRYFEVATNGRMKVVATR